MDKKIWLSVIREELELLNQLATGMIDDDHLTKEEVELAIARSKIVAKEFEMLLAQVPSNVCNEEYVPEPDMQEITLPEPSAPIVIPGYDVEKVVVVQEKEEQPIFEIILPPSEYQIPVLEPVLSKGPQSIEIVDEEKQTPQSIRSFLRTETAVPSLLNMEEKKDEFSKFKQTPLKSLKEGLILNDRYLFQRELFNNDKSKLDETVAALDRLANIQEAVEYLKSNFRWTKSEASEKFVQLVKRRFSENKG
jgi:hypothetical protein